MRQLLLVVVTVLITSACNNSDASRRFILPTASTPASTTQAEPSPPPSPGPRRPQADDYRSITVGQAVRSVIEDPPECLEEPSWPCQYFRLVAPASGILTVELNYQPGSQPGQGVDLPVDDAAGHRTWAQYFNPPTVRVTAPVEADKLYQITLWYTFARLEFELHASLLTRSSNHLISTCLRLTGVPVITFRRSVLPNFGSPLAIPARAASTALPTSAWTARTLGRTPHSRERPSLDNYPALARAWAGPLLEGCTGEAHMMPNSQPRESLRQLTLFVGAGPEALAVVEPVLDGRSYDVEFVEADDEPYATIAAMKPDLVVVSLDLDEPAGFQLLTMLRLDPATAEIPVLSYVRDEDVSALAAASFGVGAARLPAHVTRAQRH